jgi:hypothetical protein
VKIMPSVVRGVKCVGKVRGGAQGHLVEASDKRLYVVKFVNNPQGGRRILLNEMVASLLLGELGIKVAQPAFVICDGQFFEQNPNAFFASKQRQIAVEPGIHFGSQHLLLPGDEAMILDFLPDVLFPRIQNRDHFLGMLMADKWLSNADGRQTVFQRLGSNWAATMIDHGLTFQGVEWAFKDSRVQGLYCRTAVYGAKPVLRDFDPWLQKLFRLKSDLIGELLTAIPSDWLRGHEHELTGLLQKLFDRRVLIRGLLKESLTWIRERRRYREMRARVVSALPHLDTTMTSTTALRPDQP